MKHYFTFFFVVFFVVLGFSQTQAEMDKQAYNDFDKSDKQLNIIYQKVMAFHKSDKSFLDAFKKSQRIWITFRDAELNAKYPEREAGYYGSIQPICRANFLKKITDERIENLKEFLNKKADDDCGG